MKLELHTEGWTGIIRKAQRSNESIKGPVKMKAEKQKQEEETEPTCTA